MTERGSDARRVLVVDDSDDIRLLTRAVLERDPSLRVVAEAANGADAVRQWREHRPDVIVLDYRLPGQFGLEVAREILAEQPDQVIVLFSAYLTSTTIEEATAAGVRAVISKDDPLEVLDAVRRCAV
jgi:DNA-binding NarL/FixJ family response regulator